MGVPTNFVILSVAKDLDDAASPLKIIRYAQDDRENKRENPVQTFFATCPKGLELLLVDELKSLGAVSANEKRAGVIFTGNLETAYRACLWSRLANHILLPLQQFPANDADSLYRGIQTIDWSKHFSVDQTFAITFSTIKSVLHHTQFGAQKVKDAIADQFRQRLGQRPSVQREQPDIRINVHLQNDIATLSLCNLWPANT